MIVAMPRVPVYVTMGSEARCAMIPLIARYACNTMTYILIDLHFIVSMSV